MKSEILHCYDDNVGAPTSLRLAREAMALITVFFGAFLLDPGGGIGLKYVVSLLVLLWLALRFKFGGLPRVFFFLEFPIFFVFPSIVALHGVVNDAPVGWVFGAVSFSLTWIIFPLTLVVNGKDLVARFVSTMTIGAIIYIGVFAILYTLLLTGRLSMVFEVGRVMSSLDIGFFGVNPDDAFREISIPNVYFRWALLLIPAIVLVVGRSRWRFLLIATACLLSMSTGLMLFSAMALIVFYGLAMMSFRFEGWRHAMLLLAVFLIAISIAMTLGDYGVIFQQVVSKLSAGSESTSVKLGHVQSISEVLTRSPFVLLFGTGAGTEFFSSGANEYVVNVEVSHWNMVRQFGVVYFFLFSFYVCLLVLRLWRVDQTAQRLAIGVVMLFLAAGTNPLLMSPVFMIPLIVARGYVGQFGGRKLVPAAS